MKEVELIKVKTVSAKMLSQIERKDVDWSAEKLIGWFNERGCWSTMVLWKDSSGRLFQGSAQDKVRRELSQIFVV